MYLERTMILSAQGEIDAAHLPEEIRDQHVENKTEAFSEDDISPTGDQFLSLRCLGRQLHRSSAGRHRQQ